MSFTTGFSPATRSSRTDCNGKTDDPLIDATGRSAAVEHCGSSGNACAGKYGNAKDVACDVSGRSSVCVVTACQPTYFLVSKFHSFWRPTPSATLQK